MVQFRCHGCGAVVDATAVRPFRCPNAGAAVDDIDHVLAAEAFAAEWPTGSEANPFLRYRALLTAYRVARSVGLSEDAWADIVGELDEALVAVDGRGFRVTPMGEQAALARALDLSGRLWVKDETGNVSGSHKGRHLAGVMLYLRVLEAAGLPAGIGLRRNRLAIASCGNAALAAAVVARAADWPLDVFIPPDANPVVRARLAELGAGITICERRAKEAGDPCVLRFREAVAGGAIPFSVQGPDNGLAVEGLRTLAFEMADGFADAGVVPDALFVQAGGGALASGLVQGFDIARRLGRLPRVPKLMVVQAQGCAPLVRAWDRLPGLDLADAARRRSRFMWPWETVPASIAGGILDDEAYDWWAVALGMRTSGGGAVVVSEEALARAHDEARRQTDIPVSATGSAGLAGAIGYPADGSVIAAVFSGVER
jgi:threonine synthase